MPLNTISREALISHLNTITYDKNYQNIECLNFKGYDDSEPSWLKIANLPVEWEGKTVCDLGCFHGYYSMKVESLGCAKVIGLDRSEDLLLTTQLIAEYSNSNMEVELWEGGMPTPKCDIALCLNMLHHCPDIHATLRNINCEYAIFEINPENLEQVITHFDVIKIIEGRSYPDRPSRVIVYTKRK
jgi:2-polyprenyl-3-methyl-5-hydroxy-6-metoxy-1,4-benzoquinol methylase